MSSSFGGPLLSSEMIIQVSNSSEYRVARETLKTDHFSVVTDDVVLALFCSIIHLGVGESGDIGNMFRIARYYEKYKNCK